MRQYQNQRLDVDELLVYSKYACIKAGVVGKSLGQQCPYEFESHFSYKEGDFLR